jgi:hypothetical protein
MFGVLVWGIVFWETSDDVSFFLCPFRIWDLLGSSGKVGGNRIKIYISEKNMDNLGIKFSGGKVELIITG